MTSADTTPHQSSPGTRRTRTLVFLGFAVAIGCLLPCVSPGQQTGGGPVNTQAPATPPATPAVNPGRPTVTDVASLTVPGYLELESGFNYLKGGSGIDYQVSQELLLKLTDRSVGTEFRLSTNGYVFQRTSGGPSQAYAQGFGDTTFGIQHLFVAQTPKTYDLSARLEYKAPTAGRSLGTGKADYNVLLLASKDYTDSFHADYNLGQAFLGADNDAGYVGQTFASASFSYKLPHALTAQAELYGFSGNSLNGTDVATGFGLTYTPRPDVVYDGYIGFGLSRDAPTWSITVGCTFFLGKLF